MATFKFFHRLKDAEKIGSSGAAFKCYMKIIKT